MNVRITRILFSLLLAFIWNSLQGAEEYTQEFKVSEIYLENRPVIPSIFSVGQDSMGFMWFGSNEGLFRYDGRRLKGYLASDLDGFIRKRINQIESTGSSLWIMAENEFYRFNTVTDSIRLYFRNPVDKSDLEQFCLDKLGNIWIIANDNLFVIKPDGNTSTLSGKFSNTSETSWIIRGLTIDENGQVWLLKGNGIYPINLTEENLISIGNNLLPKVNMSYDYYYNYIFKDEYLFVTSKNDLWIYRLEQNATDVKAVIVKFYPAEEIFQKISVKKLYLINIYSLIVDDDYNLLLNTELGLVALMSSLQDNASSHIISQKSGQYIIEVESMFLDRRNNIFVAMAGQGVGYVNLKQQAFKIINFMSTPAAMKPYESSPVNCLAGDKDGNIWFSSLYLGLFSYNASHSLEHVLRANYEEKLDLSDYKILDLKCGPGGQIYVATYSGLDVYNVHSRKITNLYISNEDPLSHIITDLCIDDWNRLWTLVENPFGLYKMSFQDNDFNKPLVEEMNSLYSLFNDSSNNANHTLYYDSIRDELLICHQEGLNRVKFDSTGKVRRVIPYRLSELSPRGTFETFFINDVAFGGDSVYYFATNGQGLMCIEMLDETDSLGMGLFNVEHLTSEKGLRSNFINSVLIDPEGSIWIAGSGLMRWNRTTGDLTDYSNYKEITGSQFLKGSAVTGYDGNMYFGTSKGLVYLNPSDIHKVEYTIKPVITGVQVGSYELQTINTDNRKLNVLEKEIPYTRELILKYNHNDFACNFAGLYFLDPEQISYRYMLNGYDEEWIQTFNNNASGSYTNLKQGTYEFRVQTAGPDGNWNPVPASLSIRILPPWYLHPVALVSYFILLLVGLFIVRKIVRMNQKMILNEKMYEYRMQLFTNISHELQTPITLITSPLEDLLKTKLPAEATRLISLVNRNARRILALINEMMEFRRSETDNLRLSFEYLDFCGFIRQIAEYFIPIADLQNIQYNIEIPEEEIFIWVDRSH